jgi:hypothetical protein
MQEYSDDGVVFNAAYGHRWRTHFGRDQLGPIIRRLTANPDDRRSILQIWDQQYDLDTNSKDVACNTVAHFQRNRVGALDMTVFCRSNDIIWGAYGANGVHFSILQEFMAWAIGCGVGRYWQVSDNYHAYTEVYKKLSVGDELRHWKWYEEFKIVPHQLITYPLSHWLQDLKFFFMNVDALIKGEEKRFEAPPIYHDPFFRDVAHPMVAAYAAHKQGRKEDALEHTGVIRANDWALACTRWLERRYDRKGARGKGKKTDGGEMNREA